MNSASRRDRRHPLRPSGRQGDAGRPSRLATTGGVLGGEFVDDAVTTWLSVSSSGDRTQLMWPAEYAAQTNPLMILDENDLVVARGGEDVHVVGGYLPSDDRRAPRGGRIFAVSRIAAGPRL
jgi:hypothetical protein